MSTVQEDYIDSLDRLLDILRGQIDLARVVGVTTGAGTMSEGVVS
jgi:hypothetical protein